MKIFKTLFVYFVGIIGYFIGSISSILLAPFCRNGANSFVFVSKYWAKAVLFSAGIKVTVRGREHLDTKDTKIIVANHQGNFDIPIILVSTDHPFRFFVKKELTMLPFLGWYLSSRGDIPIDRANRQKAYKSIKEVVGLIKSGRSIVIFPEGTRSYDGKVGPFKKGSFLAAVTAGAKIVPVAISGSYEIQKRGSLLVNPTNVFVNIGEPFNIEAGDPSDDEYLEKLTQDVRNKVISLMAKN